MRWRLPRAAALVLGAGVLWQEVQARRHGHVHQEETGEPGGETDAWVFVGELVIVIVLSLLVEKGQDQLRDFFENDLSRELGESLLRMMDCLINEVMTLGFIGLCVYASTKTDAALWLARKIYPHSMQLSEENDPLAETFERVHMVIFFVMIIYILQCAALMYKALFVQGHTWQHWEQLRVGCFSCEPRAILKSSTTTSSWDESSPMQDPRFMQRVLLKRFTQEKSLCQMLEDGGFTDGWGHKRKDLHLQLSPLRRMLFTPRIIRMLQFRLARHDFMFPEKEDDQDVHHGWSSGYAPPTEKHLFSFHSYLNMQLGETFEHLVEVDALTWALLSLASFLLPEIVALGGYWHTTVAACCNWAIFIVMFCFSWHLYDIYNHLTPDLHSDPKEIIKAVSGTTGMELTRRFRLRRAAATRIRLGKEVQVAKEKKPADKNLGRLVTFDTAAAAKNSDFGRQVSNESTDSAEESSAPARGTMGTGRSWRKAAMAVAAANRVNQSLRKTSPAAESHGPDVVRCPVEPAEEGGDMGSRMRTVPTLLQVPAGRARRRSKDLTEPLLSPRQPSPRPQASPRSVRSPGRVVGWLRSSFGSSSPSETERVSSTATSRDPGASRPSLMGFFRSSFGGVSMVAEPSTFARQESPSSWSLREISFASRFHRRPVKTLGYRPWYLRQLHMMRIVNLRPGAPNEHEELLLFHEESPKMYKHFVGRLLFFQSVTVAMYPLIFSIDKDPWDIFQWVIFGVGVVGWLLNLLWIVPKAVALTTLTTSIGYMKDGRKISEVIYETQKEHINQSRMLLKILQLEAKLNRIGGEDGKISEAEFERYGKLYRTTYTEKKKKDIKNLFHLFDGDNSGTITFDELKALLQSMNVNQKNSATRHRIKAMWKIMDQDGSGAISWEEFVVLMAIVEDNEHAEDDSKALFEQFDIDGDGTLTVEELSESFSNVGVDLGEDTIGRLIHQVFGKSKQIINAEDFVRFLQGLEHITDKHHH